MDSLERGLCEIHKTALSETTNEPGDIKRKVNDDSLINYSRALFYKFFSVSYLRRFYGLREIKPKEQNLTNHIKH